METKIKRLAQFLFDNAHMIARELKKTEHYRSVSMRIDVHTPQKRRKKNADISFSFYDEKTTHYYLKDDYINYIGLKAICDEMNREFCAIPKPKPVEVRDTLEPTQKT